MQNIIKLYTDKIQQFSFYKKKYIINKHHILKLISFYLFFINYICNYIKLYSIILKKHKYFFNSNYYFFLIFKNKYLNITNKQYFIFFNKQLKLYIKEYQAIDFYFSQKRINQIEKAIILKFHIQYFITRKKYLYIKYVLILIKNIFLKYKIIFKGFSMLANTRLNTFQKYNKELIQKNKLLLIRSLENNIYINYLMLTFKEQSYIQQLYIQHDFICYFFTIKLNTIIVNCIDLFSKKILFNTTSTQFGFSKFKYNIRIIFEMLFKVCYEYSFLHKYRYILIYIRLCPFLKKRIFFFKMLNSLFKYKQNNKVIYKDFKKYNKIFKDKEKKNLIKTQYFYFHLKYFNLINLSKFNRQDSNIQEHNMFILNINFLNLIKKKIFYRILIFQIEYIRVFGGCRLKKIRRKRKHSRQFFKKNYKFNFFWKFNKI